MQNNLCAYFDAYWQGWTARSKDGKIWYNPYCQQENWTLFTAWITGWKALDNIYSLFGK